MDKRNVKIFVYSDIENNKHILFIHNNENR